MIILQPFGIVATCCGMMTQETNTRVLMDTHRRGLSNSEIRYSALRAADGFRITALIFFKLKKKPTEVLNGIKHEFELTVE